MRSDSKRIAVQNSLVFVRDSERWDLPEIDGVGVVWSTTSCAAVSCLPDSEGETEITIGRRGEVDPGRAPLFEGQLETPSRIVIVDTVYDRAIFEVPVPATRSRLRIWTNGHPAADMVTIGLD